MDTQTNIRRLVIEDFNSSFPPSKPTPHHSTVKKRRPDLYDFIMKKYNGYRAFLRIAKRKMPRTSRKERAFIKYSSNDSRHYYENCWSNLEELTFMVLVDLGEEDNFIHNCLFPSPSGHFYQIDFFDPFRVLFIEVDGVYHTALPSQRAKDIERDVYLSRYGRVLRLASKDFSDLKEMKNKINEFINGGYIL